MTMAMQFIDVDLLFGPQHDQVAALAMLDNGASRAEIAAKTGVVLGVAGANLAIREGEISVLMGLSGSGKSSLLRAANGLNATTRGQVLVRDGEAMIDIARCDSEVLRRMRRTRMAMVFQQFGLLPWRTVRENVGLGLELQGIGEAERRARVDEKLALVGLSDWAERHASALSGGMQQRVGLARAFCTDANILLMDEPFSALDPLIRSKLQDELCDLQERLGKTILFVSHDLDEALKLGDHISIMDGGRIIQTGTPKEIILHPADDMVRAFVDHMNPLTALTGAMAMRPLAGLVADPTAKIMSAELPLKEICTALSDGASSVTLVRDGHPIGICNAQDVMRALARRRV